MAQSTGIVVVGLKEFRAAVRAADVLAPKAIAAGLKVAGTPILAQARANAPGRVGTSLSIATSGPKASIVSSLPFQGGSEWGVRGKWAGWVAKYGSPPRFVYPAVEAKSEEAGLILMEELKQVIEIMGWAR